MAMELNVRIITIFFSLFLTIECFQNMKNEKAILFNVRYNSLSSFPDIVVAAVIAGFEGPVYALRRANYLALPPFKPTRVVLQVSLDYFGILIMFQASKCCAHCFQGFTCVQAVELGCMFDADAMNKLGSDSNMINPFLLLSL